MKQIISERRQFNLNTHGKNPYYTYDSEPGEGSVFVPEYGHSELHIVQNRKASISELTVTEKCGFDDSAAKVQLPKRLLRDLRPHCLQAEKGRSAARGFILTEAE